MNKVPIYLSSIFGGAILVSLFTGNLVAIGVGALLGLFVAIRA